MRVAQWVMLGTLLSGCSSVLYLARGIRQGRTDRPLALGRASTGSTAHGDGRHTPRCASIDESSSDEPRDHTYRFVAPESESYTFRTASGFDSVLALYDDHDRELACNDDDGESTDARLDARLERGHAYFVVVSGYRGDHGAYAVRADATRSVPAPIAPRARCMEAPVLADGLNASRIEPSLAMHANVCGVDGGRVYRVEVTHETDLRVTVVAEHAPSIALRASCDPADAEVACVAAVEHVTRRTLEAHVRPGTWFVFVGATQGTRSGVAIQVERTAPAP